MSQNDIFADTFNGIAVTGNLIRIDLATLVPDSAGGQGQQPRFESRQRLIMPIDGDARFDDRPAGWLVCPPGSAHRPTVSQGRALVLYLLPEGRIEFSR